VQIFFQKYYVVRKVHRPY